MKSNCRWMRLILLLVMILGVGTAGCVNSPAPGGPGSTNNKAPEFTLSDLSGGQVKFPDDFQGQKVALVFFSTT